ncbi:MAG: GDSL-type esterase/lipase family protein [Actinomycetota bacterium]|nr:GDSL-type esterase/lipase family protein [Actinomycetota bacterium]MED5232189.1 GDSL-type esterase/lipase family protein [Actinomycetota bacterium]MEE3354136.1 GDSL-type esterase/lipase family protein [Actinomycetota bacterium]
MTGRTSRVGSRPSDGRLAQRILTLGVIGAAWLAFDAHLGSRRVSRAREANLRARIRSIHRSNPILPGETVFLGDSITSDGDWEATFSNLGARNRGIGWDTTADVLERLDESLDGPPATVVLMIGTNDLIINVPHSQTVRNVAHILDHIDEVAPDTRIIVQSVLPRTDRYHSLVAPLNRALSRICDERELEFIDHTERFSGSDGLLDPALHDDGLHPNGEGHQVLIDALQPLLQRT